ncbi:hypothetical protein ENBRE01_1827 [Enteropsectra breve]|nr:hypothetical protein ENBRE01_1827 [Enteropsectra breve]
MSNSQKRNVLNVKMKIDVIEALDSGTKQAELVKHYILTPAAISAIKKNKLEILNTSFSSNRWIF